MIGDEPTRTVPDLRGVPMRAFLSSFLGLGTGLRWPSSTPTSLASCRAGPGDP